MPQQEPIDLTQSEDNLLSDVAEQERKKLFPKNDYTTKNLYSSTNKDALADGDDLGRGTGNFLDVYNNNAGTILDITERKDDIKINKYNQNKTYPDF
jgi:hypothetical protein